MSALAAVAAFAAALLHLAVSARVPHLLISSRAAVAADAPRVPPEFNINSGGPAVGRFIAEAPEWVVGSTSTFALDDVVIGGAEEKNLPMYKSHRFGDNAMPWGYDIPVMEPGTYGCTVHFAETHSDSFMNGKRVFDLFLATAYGDHVKFDDIDIYAELNGAEFTVLTKTAADLVIPGVLSIRVNPSAGDAIISGVTCERTGDLPPGVTADYETDPNIPTEAVTDTNTPTGGPAGGAVIIGTEINVNCGGDAVGRFLAEDPAWIRGATSFFGGPDGIEIGGAEEKNQPALISHRFGTEGEWGYVIPVSMPGLYNCSLHFAETDSESFRIGARVFDISIQNLREDDVDVYRDSGEAEFTSVVKTFLDLKVGNNLEIVLSPVTGNAFISAITCERGGDLAPGDFPGVDSPEPSPLDVTPTPDDSTSGTLEPAPTASPIVATPTAIVTVTLSQTPAVQTPFVESPSVEVPTIGVSPDVEPSPSPLVPGVEPSMGPTPSPGESPEPSTGILGSSNVELDARMTPANGESDMDYELRGVVGEGGVFTPEMKDALLAVSRTSTGKNSKWAMIVLEEEGVASVSRQDARSYRIDLQAVYNEADEKEAVEDYTSFVKDGEVNNELRAKDVSNLNVSFRNDPTLSANGDPETASTNKTTAIVGSVVGGVLALLAIVALGAFFVVRRNRSNNTAAAFDAPPPAMTESEMSSVMERSETAHSIEYLDDDSTFTAATSRAGDHVDQVAFDKDVFGRGTAAGAHGIS